MDSPPARMDSPPARMDSHLAGLHGEADGGHARPLLVHQVLVPRADLLVHVRHLSASQPVGQSAIQSVSQSASQPTRNQSASPPVRQAVGDGRERFQGGGGTGTLRGMGCRYGVRADITGYGRTIQGTGGCYGVWADDTGYGRMLRGMGRLYGVRAGATVRARYKRTKRYCLETVNSYYYVGSPVDAFSPWCERAHPRR
eukprot:411838-Prorocentrum_minimum.AAC.1